MCMCVHTYTQTHSMCCKVFVTKSKPVTKKITTAEQLDKMGREAWYHLLPTHYVPHDLFGKFACVSSRNAHHIIYKVGVIGEEAKAERSEVR